MRNKLMRRVFSLLLAGTTAVSAMVCPALAASAPTLRVEGQGSGSQQLALQNLPGRHNGVQITLELDRVPGGLTFQRPDEEEESYSTFRLEGTSVTLYVTSKRILNLDSSFAVGTLEAEDSFAITSASGLKLLNVGPDDTETIVYDQVGVNTGGSGSGSGSGSGGSGSGSGQHSISTAAGIKNGSVKFSDTSAKPGDTVTLTVLPDAGYVLDRLTVVDNTGREVAVKDLGGGKWSFVMPAAGVTVRASFVPEGSGPAETPLPFLDVGESDWFHDAVAYVYANGLMSGTENDRFSPNVPTTRGMVVTILYSYAGKPEAGQSGFLDVAPEQYYAKPVAWAAANGVVSGFDSETFGPNRVITREQMAMILYRYAETMGLDVSGRADLSRFDDESQISGYAREAVSWANFSGLITGVDSRTILPGGSATRAQVAAILRSFCENVAK